MPKDTPHVCFKWANKEHSLPLPLPPNLSPPSTVEAGLGGSADPVAVLEGDPVTLVCGTDLTGNPIPIVQWTDNNGM